MAVLDRAATEPGFRELCLRPDLALHVVIETAKLKFNLDIAADIPVGTVILFCGQTEAKFHVIRGLPIYSPTQQRRGSFKDHLACCYNPWDPPR